MQKWFAGGSVLCAMILSGCSDPIAGPASQIAAPAGEVVEIAAASWSVADVGRSREERTSSTGPFSRDAASRLHAAMLSGEIRPGDPLMVRLTLMVPTRSVDLVEFWVDGYVRSYGDAPALQGGRGSTTYSLMLPNFFEVPGREPGLHYLRIWIVDAETGERFLGSEPIWFRVLQSDGS